MNRRSFAKKILLSTTFPLANISNATEITDSKKRAGKTADEGDSGIMPELTNKQSATMVFVGDLQRYSNSTIKSAIARMMNAWIVRYAKQLNIKCALFAGDLVENNNYNKIIKIQDADLSSEGQWKCTFENFKILDKKVAYIACTGNHDYGITCFENRQTHFNDFFNESRLPMKNVKLLDMCVNAFGKPTFENACFEVDLGNAWGKIIVFSIEFCPRDSVIEWVNKTATKYSDKTAILLLHDYITMSGNFSKPPRLSRKQLIPADAKGGAIVWEMLVKKTPNIRLVLCGHSDNPKTYELEGNSSFRTDTNDAGKQVHAMCFAMHGRKYDGHGADGWLRTLEFLPDAKTVKVSTFSPYLFYSMRTKLDSRATDAKNEFTFQII